MMVSLDAYDVDIMLSPGYGREGEAVWAEPYYCMDRVDERGADALNPKP
jgi:hypothetical protein